MSLLFEASVNYDDTAQLVPDMSDGACPDLVQEIESRLARTMSDTEQALINVVKRRSSPLSFPLQSGVHPPAASRSSWGTPAHGTRRISEAALGQFLKHDLSAAELTELDSLVSELDDTHPLKEAAAATAAHTRGATTRTPLDYYESSTLDYATAVAIERYQRMGGDTPMLTAPVTAAVDELPDAPSAPIMPASCPTPGAGGRPRRQVTSPRRFVAHTAPKATPSRSKAAKAAASQSSPPRAGHAAADAEGWPLPLDPTGVLPADHRPARGRGRAQQLKSMTKAQIAAEATAMREKNRAAARDLRLKRKDHEARLQARIDALEAKDVESQRLIARLTAKLDRLEHQ